MDIAIDPSGKPFVAFMDQQNSSQFRSRVMRYSGSTWVDLVPPPLGGPNWTPGLSQDRGISYSLAFDSTGTALIAYYAFNADYSPKEFYVFKYAGSTWSQLGTVGVSPGINSRLVLRMGAGNVPYLAVSGDNAAGSGFGQLLSYSALAWNKLRTDSFGFSGGVSAVAISPSLRPYFAYTNSDTPTYLHLALGEAGGWSAVGGNLPAVYNPAGTPIAVDQNGVPYIAFNNYDSEKLSVMKYANGAWTSVGPAEITSTGADNICLKLNPSGTPYVLYRSNGFSGGTDGKAYLMKFDGSNWVYVGGQAVSPGICNWLALAFNSKGDPYVAFRDVTAGNKASVMTFQ
jgi:hypothetical protein